jgi:hypothetical protein
LTYLLSTDGVDDGSPGHYQRYKDYLQSVKAVFPPSAFTLASSDWYHDYRDHRCPHDAWLQSVVLSENTAGMRQEERTLSITIRLLGAYHDGYIELHYPRVFAYRLDAWEAGAGHKDWRYNELRLSDKNTLIHEIEWCGMRDTGRWLIEASDVAFRWLPKMAT